MQRVLSKKQRVISGNLINYYSYEPSEHSRSLVFLHGWRSDATAWKQVMNNLHFEDIALYALDLPGFGQSQIPESAYGVDDYVRVVKGFIEELGLKNVILVGHSFGGRISTKYAARTSLDSLVLVDSGGINELTLVKYVKSRIAKIFKPAFRISALKPLRIKIYNLIGSSDYVATPYLRDTFLKIIGEDLRGEMKNISVPTAIIWGTKDKETPFRWAREMNELIPNSKLYAIEGAGHYSFIDQPDAFLQIMEDILK